MCDENSSVGVFGGILAGENDGDDDDDDGFYGGADGG